MSRSRPASSRRTSETAPDSVGGRALLNLGHTFGHVIETLPRLTLAGREFHPLHGEAVGLGLIAATAASAAANPAESPALAEIVELVRSASLPTCVGGLPPVEQLVGLMHHDKTISGQLRCIFPLSHARAMVSKCTGSRVLDAGWAAISEATSARR